jgi:hypothetical protein
VGLVGGHTIFDSGNVHGFGRSVISEQGLLDVGTFPLEPIGKRTLDSNVWRPNIEFPGGRPYETDTVLATCVGFRLEDAKAIGGYDSRFNPVWIEDDDFGLAMRRAGKKVIVDPELRILHKVSLRGSRIPGEVQNHSVQKKRKVARGSLWTAFKRNLNHAMKPLPVNVTPVKGILCFGTTEWRQKVLLSHYQRWNEKWGFDPLNPDMESVFDQYYDTELCWRYNRARFLRGRELITRVAEG